MSQLITDLIAFRSIQDGDCIRWTGTMVNGRHPVLFAANAQHLVRRWLWEQERGPIPAGKILRCTCGMLRCIHLGHVQLTTYRAVAEECGAKGLMSGPVRSAKIAATKRAGPQAVLTDDQVAAIRAGTESVTAAAAAYGVSPSTVNRIRRGEMRRDFAGPMAGIVAALVGGAA